MITFIIIVTIALFAIAIGFTWYRLQAYEKTEKIIFIIIGILICLIITTIIFSISSNGIDYINSDAKGQVAKILISVFTPINIILTMPYIAKILSKMKFDEIDNDKARKKILSFFVIFIILLIIETIYLSSIQSQILDIANKM